MAAGDAPLPGVVRVADPRPQEEPVQLGLRQGERPLELDGVLGREDEERVREDVGRAFDRDLALLHRLEEGALRAGRRAVDLVDEEDVREHGPLDEPEAGRLEQAGARHVGRQQVGRALDAGHAQVERAGDGAREERLARARDVLEQHVAVGEERDDDEADRVLRTDDGLRDRCVEVVPQAPAGGDDIRAVRLGIGGHAGAASSGRGLVVVEAYSPRVLRVRGHLL